MDVGDLLGERRARALRVQVVHEVDDAAVVLERVTLALTAAVDELDLQPTSQEGGLTEALAQDRVVVLDRLEDLEVRQEGDLGAAAVGRGALLERRHRLPTLVLLDRKSVV